ncbi:ribulokinase [Pedobacter duraquae]|uniref:L-ribulokinase n=1 Tax=Pedobacter duraquae TaxID=425511 RepID=A0A4R6IKD7_9SPHI|nr:ribulokinase [Pedobacter duraquae]TDO22529.1 L-ribulokinase [Pedobacter duraquae]
MSGHLKYVIGLDFGTDSVRALLVDALTGVEVESAVHFYTRWKQGLYCDAALSQFRQHPLDFEEGMEITIKSVLAKVGPQIASGVVGLSIDTTGSSPVALDDNGRPLALSPAFAENPNAMVILWKDHTAALEAEEINSLAHSWETDYTQYSGGVYSPEWFWSKILHTIKTDADVAQAAYSWAEHCDWMPALLTGNSDPRKWKRSRCAAGHKAMWHNDFGGLPSESFLTTLHPALAGLRDRLYTETYTSDEAAGRLSSYWAERLGLPEQVVIGVGALDAHFGAVGSAITPFSLVKVMGTSTCDMLTAPNAQYERAFIKGICGQVDGSIMPGMLGMEAGQSAFGDVYSWFRELLEFPLRELLADYLPAKELARVSSEILPALSKKAALLPLTVQDVVATDWINGRRTPDTDLGLKAAIYGLQLGIGAAHIFKALVEATAFGSKAIVDQFEKEGVPIERVIALGGIAKKSPFVMQTLANVLNIEILVVKSDQACALGATMFAATVSGLYENVAEAQKTISSGFDATYYPQADKVSVYEVLYQKYVKLGLAMES